jgi:hypothetical protein
MSEFIQGVITGAIGAIAILVLFQITLWLP